MYCFCHHLLDVFPQQVFGLESVKWCEKLGRKAFQIKTWVLKPKMFWGVPLKNESNNKAKSLTTVVYSGGLNREN